MTETPVPEQTFTAPPPAAEATAVATVREAAAVGAVPVQVRAVVEVHHSEYCLFICQAHSEKSPIWDLMVHWHIRTASIN